MANRKILRLVKQMEEAWIEKREKNGRINTSGELH